MAFCDRVVRNENNANKGRHSISQTQSDFSFSGGLDVNVRDLGINMNQP